jgi:hypothetical protein
MFNAGVRLVERLLPKADADATCAVAHPYCYCSLNHAYYQTCTICSDGSSYCSGCTKTEYWCAS